MKLPFTIEQFLGVFENYNQSIWPLQILFYILGLIAIVLCLKIISKSAKIVFTILGFFWIWMGIVYNLVYFTTINKAAYIFGAMFIIQGMLFLYFAFLKQSITFRFRSDLYGITGSILILFALVIYPVLGYFLGHRYPASPTFGVPCPTTIFTFGLLLWSNKKIPLVLLIIPMLWAIIGFSAAFSLGVKEDIGLIIAGFISSFLILKRNAKLRKGYALTRHSS